MRMLNIIGFYNWRDPFLYENPRKLMTEDFVQDGYLEYRQAPDSDPPSHEFLWSPRTFAKTTKMKVLEFFLPALLKVIPNLTLKNMQRL